MTIEPPNRERTDLFEIEESNRSGVGQVKESKIPELQRAKRMRRIGKVVGAVLAVVAVLVAGRMLLKRRAYHAALDAVTTIGTPASIESALAVVSRAPVRARLLARAAWEGDADKTAEAKQLAEAGSDDDPDTRIALIYLALAEGDVPKAQAEVAKPGRFGRQGAEFLHVRALTSMAAGQWDQVMDDALTAQTLVDDSAQAAALLAIATAQREGAAAGLAKLTAMEDAQRESPVARVTEARLQLAANDWAKAKAAADGVEASDLSVREQAWLATVRARVADEEGALVDRAKQLTQGAIYRGAGDELLILARARALLDADRVQEAQEGLARLRQGPSANLEARVHLIAWLLARLGKPNQGLSALQAADFDPDKATKGRGSAFRALAVGQTRAASSSERERRRAVALYEHATRDNGLQLSARRALLQLLAQTSIDTERTTQLVESALQTRPNHPDLARLAVPLFQRLELGARALQAARKSVEAHPEEVGAWIALGLAQRGLGAHGEALAAFAKAVELEPDRADWNALLGDAAMRTGDAKRAAVAWDRALASDPNHEAALAGALALKLDAGALQAAQPLAERLKQIEDRSETADLAILRDALMRGEGRAAIDELRGAISRHSKNAQIRLLGAQLHLQAEEYTRANILLDQARRLGANEHQCLALEAITVSYARKFRTAERLLDNLDKLESETPADIPLVIAAVWIVKARQALQDDKKGAAQVFATRAQERAANDAHVHLLLADIASARQQDPSPHLRAANDAAIPLPLAAGRLALLLAPGTDVCALAARYLNATRSGSIVREVRTAAKDCE